MVPGATTTDVDVVSELDHVSPDRLSVDGDNPNHQNGKQYEGLKESIREYGFFMPIVANEDYVIADGEHRWQAAQELGIAEVPVVVLDVEDVDRRIIRQITNKLSGRHDLEADAVEFDQILEQRETEDLSTFLATDAAEVENTVEQFMPDDDDVALPGDDDEADPDSSSAGSEDPTDVDLDADADGSTSAEDEDVPDEFGTMGADDVETDHECPSCGYEW